MNPDDIDPNDPGAVALKRERDLEVIDRALLRRRDLFRTAGIGLLLVPAATTMTGCATLWDWLNRFIKAPDLEIRKMEIQKMTLTSITVKFFADLFNPNKIGFRLNALDYLMKLEGNSLATGSARKGIDLRAGARSKTELDFTFDVGKTASAILSMLEKDSVNYEIEMVGRFLGGQNSGGIEVPANFKGRMPMPDLPATNVRSFRATDVSLSGIGFRVETAMKNTNDFELPIDKVQFDVKLNNKNVLSNKSAGSLRIAPGKTSTVPFDFNVGLIEAGLTAAELASGARLNYEVKTEIKSGKLLAPFTNRGTVNVSR